MLGQKAEDGGQKAVVKAVEEQILGMASSMPAKEWKKEKARLLALLKAT